MIMGLDWGRIELGLGSDWGDNGVITGVFGVFIC